MIELRTTVEADRSRLFVWRNLPAVADYMYTDHEITREEHDRWFDATQDDARRWYRIIELDSEPVGLASITDIDHEARRCSWAFYLAADSVRGRGVGSWVEFQVIETAFEKMGMNKLCCEVLTLNDGVIAMHEGFGFRREGYLREHVHKSGKALDVVALALLRDEWALIKPTIADRLRSRGLIGATS